MYFTCDGVQHMFLQVKRLCFFPRICPNYSTCPSHNRSQGHNPQESAWDKHAPLQPSKVAKPKQAAQPLPLDEALAEIRNSTASIIDFQVNCRVFYILMCRSFPLSPFFPICYCFYCVCFLLCVFFLFAVDCNAVPLKRALQLLEQRLKQGRAPEEVPPAHVPSSITLNVMWLHNTPAAATHPPAAAALVTSPAAHTVILQARCAK